MGVSVQSNGPLSLRILGPLRLWQGPAEVDAGPRQQAYLLALLVARVGEPVSTGELVDLLWGEEAPATAINVIHKYVGALRRILEPSLPIRDTGSHLLRRRNGYVFEAGAGTLDLVTFRELVETARAAPGPEATLDRYVEALGLWHGPAGDGLSLGPDAMAVFAGLNGEFFEACVAAAKTAVALGRAGQVLAPLEQAAAMAPLDETVQASRVLALGAAGQQAKALSIVRTVRARLADQLGVAPGEVLIEAQRQVLRQTMTTVPEPQAEKPPPAGMIGRGDEMEMCRRAVAAAVAGRSGLVLVEGEPGVGKSRLLEEVATEADRQGAFVVWGRCLEGEGTPSMWPWTQVVGALLESLSGEGRRHWFQGELGRLVEPRDAGLNAILAPDNRVQFRLFEEAVALVAEVANAGPLVVIVDDLQWADVASLRLFGHLAARLPGGTTVLGALRDRAPALGPELLHELAAASRIPWQRRICLGPLGLAEMAELILRETGKKPSEEDVRVVHNRTAGNPFFVQELCRSRATNTEVPSPVRDVVRARVARLDQESLDVLETAALVGRDVDLRLLAAATGLDVQACLDRVEPLVAMGLLEPVAGNPYSLRFAHDLVREAVVGAAQPRQTVRVHLRIADALELLEPASDATPERLAFHLRSAGPSAAPGRAAEALMRAAHRATAKTALEAAERHLTAAAQVARSAGLAEVELTALTQLTMIIGMRLGYPAPATEILDRAEYLARSLGRYRDAADILFARFIKVSQAIQPDRGQLARRLFEWAGGFTDPVVRACGFQAWGLRQWDIGNIAEAHRYLDRAHRTLTAADSAGDDNPLQRDLLMAWPMMQGVVTALHGDVDQARSLLLAVEATTGEIPYAITISSHYSGMAASMIDDPLWGARVVRRWLAAGPQDYLHVDNYLYITRCWVRARTGDDPAAAEGHQVMAKLLDPPQWGISFNYGLVAEMHLLAGQPAEAADTLDRADHYLDVLGQRYAEGMLLLLRARVGQALGQTRAEIRATAEEARVISAECGAHLFAGRAERFLAALDQ